MEKQRAMCVFATTQLLTLVSLPCPISCHDSDACLENTRNSYLADVRICEGAMWFTKKELSGPHMDIEISSEAGFRYAPQFVQVPGAQVIFGLRVFFVKKKIEV